MAEYVEQRMEEMMNEVEQMERVMLLTNDEVKELVRKRKQYEYKLQKRMKMKEDFLEYIQYESNLLKLLEIRRENIGYHHKVGEIEGSIKTRINKLFKILEHRNQADVTIWLSHIQFLKTNGWEEAVSRIYLRMLQVHNDKPGLWVEAASWEFETVGSAENARKILLRGLRFLPKSWILQREYVKLELLYVEQLRKRQSVLKTATSDEEKADVDNDKDNEADDKVLNCSIVRLVINNAVDTLNDPKFIVSLIATVRMFDFAEEVAQELFTVLEDKFPECPITWDTLAREMLKEGVNDCTDKYLAGLEKLPSKELFQLAFSTLTECSSVYPKSIVRITKNILKLLEAGKEAGLLGAEHYRFWIQLLDDEVHGDKKTEIIADAVSKYPGCVDIRTEQLLSTNSKAAKMSKDRGSKARLTCFSDAVDALKEDREASVRIWEVMLSLVDSEEGWRMLSEEDSLLDSTNPQLRLLHLDRASYRGVGVARAVYSAYRDQPPFSAGLHRRMLAVEREQERVEHGQLRSVLATMCTQFGDQDPLCWLEAAKLEIEDGKPLEAAKILARAEASLNNEQRGKFAVLRDKMGV